METKTKIFPSGKAIEYTLTREKGFFTSHIWIYKDGKPYLHFMPGDSEGWSKCFKFCGGSYMSMGEVAISFNEITLNRIYLS